MNIYGDLDSGNCLKVKYVADCLGLSYRWIPVDIMQGENRKFRLSSYQSFGSDPGRRIRGRSLSCAIERHLALSRLGQRSAAERALHTSENRRDALLGAV